MLLVIKKVKSKPFTGDEGQVDYFWTTAERPDGLVVTFGGRSDYSGKIGSAVELLLEERTFSNGRKGLVEVV